jgi:hypothetical protein
MHNSNEETVTLIARFLQEGIPSTVPGEPPKSPPLTPEVTGKLIDLAIQLHDREAQRRDRWKSVLIPMVVAILAATASIISAIIGYNSKVMAPPASQIIPTQPTIETKVPAKKESGQNK